MTKVQQTRCILQAAPVVNGLRKCARKLLLVLIRSAVESHGVCVHVTMYACMLVYVIYVYVCNTVYTCFIVCSILELTAPVSRNTLSFSKFTCVCTHIAATQHTMVISQTVTLLLLYHTLMQAHKSYINKGFSGHICVLLLVDLAYHQSGSM
jgi:hypothetical protein